MSDITLNNVTEAICERFIANWVNKPTYVFDGEDFQAPANSPWIRVSIRNKIGVQETLGQPGNRKFERRGLIIANIFTPINAGRQQADTLAQAFKDIFEGASFNGVCCYSGTFKELGTDGLWYQVAVEINFVYYETK